MEGNETSEAARALAISSRTVAWWTLIGRLSGFLRVSAIAAVLGPTFFGNLFQTALLVPYTLSELLAGSLIPSLLAPRLVRLLTEGDREGADRLAASFMRVLVATLCLIAMVAALAAPFIAWLVTLAVSDAQVRAQQMALATPLLVTLLPQVVFDGFAAVGIAAQIARRQFAFPTAAPIVKNAGLILTLVAGAAVYGTGHEIDAVTVGEVLFLGVGATAAAGLHAAAQLWGARRAGFHLFRFWGAPDPAVGMAMRTAITSSGTAGLNSVASLALVAAAGHVPGGAIALQVGQYLLGLPIALGVRSIATVQLPHLAAPTRDNGGTAFQQTYRAGLRLCLFMAVPVAFVFLALPQILANALSFGGMGTAGGAGLVAAVIIGLAPGIVAEAVFVLSMSASYAQLDATTPLLATVARTVACVIGIPLALIIADPNAALFCLGLASSMGAAAGAGWLVLGNVGMRGAFRGMARWLALEGLVSAAVVLPATVVALALLPATVQNRFIDGALLLLTGVLYLAIQLARNSVELSVILGLRGRVSTGRWRHAD